MGLAEGFASGFGLVDAALQRRHANELEEQKMAQDRFYKEREYGLKDAELGVLRQKANTEAGLADAHGKEALSKAKYYDNQAGLEASKNSETVRHNKAEEGIHQTTADASLLGAKATADYHEQQRKAAEQKSQQEERLDSARQLQSYFVADPNTGDFKINMMPGEEGRVVELAKKGLGRDLIAIGRNLPEYQQHLNVMKDAAMNPGKYAGNNPNLINAFNAFNGPDLQKGVGEVDKDGNVIESKKAAGIIFHPDESDPTNVDKGYYTVALEVSGKTKDGKPFSRIAPMTQYRSADEANDPNVRVFTHDQFVRLVDGDNGVVNILLHKPEFTRSLVDSATNMTGKAKSEDKNIQDNYLKFNEKKTNPTTSEETESTVYKDPKTGREIRLGSGYSAGGKNQGIEIRYDADGNAYTRDENGKVVPYSEEKPTPRQQQASAPQPAPAQPQQAENPQTNSAPAGSAAQSAILSNDPSRVLDVITPNLTNEDIESIAGLPEAQRGARILAIRDRMIKQGAFK